MTTPAAPAFPRCSPSPAGPAIACWPVTDHGLLLRHAESWASTKGRAFDRHLVETVLDLRQRHDAVAATHWPAGSVERCSSRCGPPMVPPTPRGRDLVAALDTFFRFLRATAGWHLARPAGAAGEGSPPRLPEDGGWIADPGHHSQSRVLEDFGREIGIELDGADSIEGFRIGSTGSGRVERPAGGGPSATDAGRAPKGLVGQVVRGLQEMLAESEGAAAREGREPWPRWGRPSR